MKLTVLTAALILSASFAKAGNLESLSFNNAASLSQAAGSFKALFAEPTEPTAKQKMLDEKLRSAASSANVDEIRRLVKLGANPNANDGYNSLPLAQAVMSHGDIATLQALVEIGADVKGKGVCDYTALHYAADYGRLEAAQWLVGKGADFDAKACLGETPLIASITNDKTDVFSYLLGLGADPNARDWRKKSALTLAVGLFRAPKDNVILNALLADRRLDPNLADEDGVTALKAAVKNNSVDTVKLLLAVPGIDVNNDAGGTTALFLAELNKYDEVAALLRAAGGRSIAAK